MKYLSRLSGHYQVNEVLRFTTLKLYALTFLCKFFLKGEGVRLFPMLFFVRFFEPFRYLGLPFLS